MEQSIKESNQSNLKRLTKPELKKLLVAKKITPEFQQLVFTEIERRTPKKRIPKKNLTLKQRELST